jgi:integrase/recombinase XerD
MERITSSALIKGFERDCHLRDMPEETIRCYRSDLRIFFDFIEKDGGNILSFENEDLERFLEYLRNERNVSQPRIKHYFSVLSSFYDYLLFKKYVKVSIILPFRKRFIRSYKKNYKPAEKKLLSVEEMAFFINSIIPIRAKFIAIFLAKTGVRRGELLKIELDDINHDERSILLKPCFHKRTNRLIFYDEEVEIIMKRWMKRRQKMVNNGVNTLLVNDYGWPMGRNSLYNEVVKWAKKLGYYDKNSKMLEDHFSPHCFRHFFTTYMRKNGMPRAFIQELRGDARNDAIDIYDHIDKDELRKSYLAHIPKFDVI